MVDIKVGGPATAQGPDKKKDVKRPTGGPSFAHLLDDTSAASEASPTLRASFPQAYVPLEDATEDDLTHPRGAKRQARDLMDSLQTLAEDVLAGEPSQAAARLEAALQAEVTDLATLSPEAKQVFDELSTRAAVAAAKANSK